MATTGHNTLRCPVCPEVVLKPLEVRGIEVDVCMRCEGVWYDKGEFEKLNAPAAQALTAHGSQVTTRCCPRDGEPMQRMDYPGTLAEVEVCPVCLGVWLDRGESKEIRAVREHVRRAQKLGEFAPIPGVKGRVIRQINRWIDSLTHFED